MDHSFLAEFVKHLQVGEPKRTELIAELKNHLHDNSGEHLGDPKILARQYNRTHLGIFCSWSRLAWLAAASSALFEIMTFSDISGALRHRGLWSTTLSTVAGLINNWLPIVVMVIAAHAISNMHRRWRLLAQWVLVVTALLSAHAIAMNLLGYNLTIPERPQLILFLTIIGQTFAIVGLISLLIVWLTIGHRTFIPRHLALDLIITFFVLAFGGSILLNFLTDFFNGFFRNKISENIQAWIAYHPIIAALLTGLIGTAIEWRRISRQTKLRTSTT